MSVELLQTLSFIAYILAGILFLVAVALFFYLKVPALWGEVSGRTARKAIQAMKWKGEDAFTQPVKRSDATAPWEKAPLSVAEQKPPLKAAPTADAAQQDSLATKEAELGETAVLPTAKADTSEPMADASVGATELLSRFEPGETAVLSAAAHSEFVIRSTGELPRADETTLLDRKQRQQQSAASSVFFVMEKELAFTDSTEIIE